MADISAVGAVLHVEADDIQLAGGGDLWVELAHGAGCGIAGIGKQHLAVYLPLGVELLKDRLGHVDLAAHDETRGGVLDAQRQGAHGAQVLGHVLADETVAARRTADKDAVFILQRHGQPVDLRLHGVGMGAVDQGIHAVAEGVELVDGENVRQALQRDLMLHLLKLAQGLPAHALGRGVGRDELRVLRLQLFKPLHEHVKVIVGDDGRVLHIVKAAVIIDLPAELVDFLLYVHG